MTRTRLSGFRGRGQVLGRPVAVDVRDAGFCPAARDGFAWLGEVEERSAEAIQCFAEWLRAAGAENFRIDVGDGGVITAGAPEPGQRWRVGLRHPGQPGRVCAVLSLADHAVATSVDDARLSLTVIAADLGVAEATATTAVAMGCDGIEWAAAQPGCLVVVVTADGLVHGSAGLGELIERA